MSKKHEKLPAITAQQVYDELNMAAIEAWNEVFPGEKLLLNLSKPVRDTISGFIKAENDLAKKAKEQGRTYEFSPQYNEFFAKLQAKREKIIAKEGYEDPIINTGSNYVCIAPDKSVYLVKRGEMGNPVGNIGGLCERTPASISSDFENWLSSAGAAKEMVGKLLTAFADKENKEWREAVNEIFDQAKELALQDSSKGFKAHLADVLKDNAEFKDLVSAIDFLETHKTALFKLKPEDSLYSEKGFELLSGGKDDIILQDGKVTYTTNQDIIVQNNFLREGNEEVGRLGDLNIARIIEDGRSVRVDTSGVKDYGWVLGNKGKALGNPFIENGDFLVHPAVTMIFLTAEEAEHVNRAAKDLVSNAEVQGIVKHSLEDALRKAVMRNTDGGFQYKHETYPELVLAVIKLQEAKEIKEITPQTVKEGLAKFAKDNEMAADLLETIVKPSGISVDKLCSNLSSTINLVIAKGLAGEHPHEGLKSKAGLSSPLQDGSSKQAFI